VDPRADLDIVMVKRDILAFLPGMEPRNPSFGDALELVCVKLRFPDVLVLPRHRKICRSYIWCVDTLNSKQFNWQTFCCFLLLNGN
jgi:hypothetical protein